MFVLPCITYQPHIVMTKMPKKKTFASSSLQTLKIVQYFRKQNYVHFMDSHTLQYRRQVAQSTQNADPNISLLHPH